MITEGDFYKLVINKFDKTEIKISSLDEKISSVDKKISDHLLIKQTIEDEKNEKINKKDRKIYIIIGIMGTIIGIIEFFNNFL